MPNSSYRSQPDATVEAAKITAQAAIIAGVIAAGISLIGGLIINISGWRGGYEKGYKTAQDEMQSSLTAEYEKGYKKGVAEASAKWFEEIKPMTFLAMVNGVQGKVEYGNWEDKRNSSDNKYDHGVYFKVSKPDVSKAKTEETSCYVQIDYDVENFSNATGTIVLPAKEQNNLNAMSITILVDGKVKETVESFAAGFHPKDGEFDVPLDSAAKLSFVFQASEGSADIKDFGLVNAKFYP